MQYRIASLFFLTSLLMPVYQAGAHEEQPSCQDTLDAGLMNVNLSDSDTDPAQAEITRGCGKKSKRFCKLCVCCLSAARLTVTGDALIEGDLTVNGSLFGPGGSIIGAAGPTGATGATGATGETPILAYGYVYNLGASQTVNPSVSIRFSTNGPLLNMTHVAGNPSIAVTNAGTYHIAFSATATTPNQFGIFIIRTGLLGYGYATQPATVVPVAALGFQNTGFAIVDLLAGDVIEIKNLGIASVVLPPTVALSGPNLIANAAVTIIQVG